MDALDAIMTRRSVRRFSSEPVDDATVRALLGAAMQAPSAANEQPWQFVVIDDRGALDAIPSFSPYAASVRGAPLGILVCADTRSLPFPGFWVQDCSAAIQNLLLAAHALGLGAVWTGSTRSRTGSRGSRGTATSPTGWCRSGSWCWATRPSGPRRRTGSPRTGSIGIRGEGEMERIRVSPNVALPMPVVLVGTLVGGRPNFMPAGWCCRANLAPPMLCCGISRAHATRSASGRRAPSP